MRIGESARGLAHSGTLRAICHQPANAAALRRLYATSKLGSMNSPLMESGTGTNMR
jgi:hypothetical protein